MEPKQLKRVKNISERQQVQTTQLQTSQSQKSYQRLSFDPQNNAQQINQYKSKIQSLQQINKQLTGIIQSTQLQEYSQLVTQINQLESKHNSELGNYKLKVMQLENQLLFTEKQKNNQIQQLVDKVSRTQRDILHFKSEVNRLSRQLVHYRQNYQKARKQLKNQQALIDSFKMSIDEQIILEKQVLKSNFQQKQFQMKSQYQQKLKSMQQTYKKKLSKISQGGIQNQYKKELKSLGKYLSQKKNNSNYMSNGKLLINANVKPSNSNNNQNQLTVFAVNQQDNINSSIRKGKINILGEISLNSTNMHSDKGLGSKYSTINSHKEN